MGRIQSSIGLITGTDIVGTVDQLIAISARPRDRLLARTETLQREQQALAELTALVIGVQLAGNQLSSPSLFRSKLAESSDVDAISVEAGDSAPLGTHRVRTLRTAATHAVGSLRRFASADQALGYSGNLRIHPNGGFVDGSASLTSLNGGRGVEAGVIRITDRSGLSADIDLTGAREVNDVIEQINAAAINVQATTVGNSIRLIDRSSASLSNLIVEQVGSGETAADLGLWGINAAADTVTGVAIELAPGTSVLRGVSLSELGGGSGAGSLTTIEITLSDGSSASVDLSSATNTAEVIDAIAQSGLSLIAGLNDARNGFRIRDVSGGSGTLSISSSDGTASSIGLQGSAAGGILVGANLNRQTVTGETLLASLNQGSGVNGGSLTIRDGAGGTGAVNLTVEGIKSIGELIDAINGLGISVTAQLSDTGDGITVVDTSGGPGTLVIEDTGSGTAAKTLGIAGTATNQVVAGANVSALVGTQAINVTVEAADTLETIAARISEQGRYAEAAVQSNDDGTFSLQVRSLKGGESGRLAINTSGFDLDWRTQVRGQDALIAVSTEGGIERFLTSPDGVFEIEGSESKPGTPSSQLDTRAGNESDTDSASGLVLTLKQLASDPLTITVREDPEAVVKAAKAFADQYNLLVDKLDSLTFFNAETEEVGLLFGSSEALRIRSGYGRLLSGRIVGAGDFRSVGQVGLRLKDDGKLSLNETELREAIANDRADVEEFFTNDGTGLADRLSAQADRIAGIEQGMLLNRGQTLTTQIEFNQSRIESLNARLERERERLLRQFYATEEAIARIQSNQVAIQQIQPITIPTS